MILYVNGDEYSSAAKVANDYSFANDDFTKVAFGKKPHPDNLALSWGMQLSKLTGLAMVNEAESYCSNDRIMRTTMEFVRKLPTLDSKLTVIAIGWTDWSNEEWFDEETNEYVQISIDGSSVVPEKWNKRYKEYRARTDHAKKMKYWHDEIWELHHYLKNIKIPHLFFNSCYPFSNTVVPVREWESQYLDPYYMSFLNYTVEVTRNITPREYRIRTQTTWANLMFMNLTDQLNNV
jgi:hypothetical protein